MVKLEKSIVAVLVIISCTLAMAESARSLWNKGVKAEARQDYEAAYQYYKAVYGMHPDDLKYRVAFERVRFLAAASLVKRAQTIREQGQMEQALQLFAKAEEIDPSNDLARQESQRTQELIKTPSAQEPALRKNDQQPATPASSEHSPFRSLEDTEEPIELCSISRAPLEALKLSRDIKTIYETLGRIAGINVLFDSEFASRTLSIELRGVTSAQCSGIAVPYLLARRDSEYHFCGR